jgi:hypothetical protein
MYGHPAAAAGGIGGIGMKRVLGMVTAGVMALALAGPAAAGQPNNQACLGHDVSGYAAAGSGFGAFVAGIASTTQGIGSEVQAHLAGQVPDEALPNTCND